jgi:hypothetical protein
MLLIGDTKLCPWEIRRSPAPWYSEHVAASTTFLCLLLLPDCVQAEPRKHRSHHQVVNTLRASARSSQLAFLEIALIEIGDDYPLVIAGAFSIGGQPFMRARSEQRMPCRMVAPSGDQILGLLID